MAKNKISSAVKFSDNNLNRLEGIKEILDGFQDDCEIFLRHFVDKNDITFKCFKQVWVEHSMWEFFEDQQFVSLHVFGTYFYNIICKFLAVSESNYVRAGALYLMYTVDRYKYFGSEAKIRLTVDQILSFKSWINKLIGYGIHDVGFAFHFLKVCDVFQIVADARSFGLENKYGLSSHSVKNNIFTMKETLDSIPFNVFHHDEEVNLKNFDRIDQEYEELMGKFVQTRVKSTFDNSIVDQLKLQLTELQSVINTPEEVSDGDEEEDGEMEENMPVAEKYTMKPINYKALKKKP